MPTEAMKRHVLARYDRLAADAEAASQTLARAQAGQATIFEQIGELFENHPWLERELYGSE